MSPSSNKWSLIGIPDHQGVIHVGGRIGAARGPAEFRRVFAKLNGRDLVRSVMLDCGDLGSLSHDVSHNLGQAAEFVKNSHRAAGLSVVVGGSHEHGYSHLLGVAQALSSSGQKPQDFKIGCINIDAHLDVRKPAPLITSGSPFHLAIESGLLDPKCFIEFGIQSHCNAPELWDFVERRKVKVVPFEDLRHGKAIPAFRTALKKLAGSCDAVVISLDLDAANEAAAPGVSAPQAEGFSATDLIEMAEAAGDEAAVASLGIFELNPEHDIGGRTSRLAATAAYHFVSRALRR